MSNPGSGFETGAESHKARLLSPFAIYVHVHCAVGAHAHNAHAGMHLNRSRPEATYTRLKSYTR